MIHVLLIQKFLGRLLHQLCFLPIYQLFLLNLLFLLLYLELYELDQNHLTVQLLRFFQFLHIQDNTTGIRRRIQQDSLGPLGDKRLDPLSRCPE